MYVPYDSFHIYTLKKRTAGTGTCWVRFPTFFFYIYKPAIFSRPDAGG